MRQEKKTDTKNGVVRLVLVVVAIALQIYWIYLLVTWIDNYSTLASYGMQLTAFAVVMYIYGRHTNAAMKMPWIILIQVVPVLGVLLYFLMGRKNANFRMRTRFQHIDAVLMPTLLQNRQVLEDEQEQNETAAGISHYLWNTCGYPVYHNTDVKYYSDPVPALEDLKEALRSAKEYIFMEYHAIEDRESFAEIHEILKEKAAQGLDVRIFYDDVGSIGFINTDFSKRLDAEGIRCRVFNPVVPLLNIFMNNRDHRKITVVDGRVAFTGGYNLANEYFHVTQPYGFWKDTGVRLTGDCVPSFTIMFLEMWNAIHAGDQDDLEVDRFFQVPPHHAQAGAGFVQPYADSPLDEEHTGENVYLDVLSGAKKYAWFITPYLIITDDMQRCFSLAAKRGVDVRIITPGVPDKKLTYQVTRSYYAHLVQGGVRIFEFTPGFCHAKMCVSDDHIATCGTINLDYRSLYHHFENGVFLSDSDAVTEIKKDFEGLFPQCREVTEKYRGRRSMLLRIWQCFLRLFAPLL